MVVAAVVALVTTWCTGVLFGSRVWNNLGKYSCVFNINDPYVRNVKREMFMVLLSDHTWADRHLFSKAEVRDSPLLILLPCWVRTVIGIFR